MPQLCVLLTSRSRPNLLSSHAAPLSSRPYVRYAARQDKVAALEDDKEKLAVEHEKAQQEYAQK